MDAQTPLPTSSETTVAQRQQMVTLHQQGWSYVTIGTHLGCSHWTVGRWVRAHAAGGDAALAYHARRPQRPHPLTTAPVVQARIRALREQHPGWGARLIRHQLDRDGVTPLPSEVTVHAWLRRQGFPLVRPPRHKALGWTQPSPVPASPVWQADFKQKGGTGT